MRKTALLSLMLVAALSACATLPPEVNQADKYRQQGEKIRALNIYEDALADAPGHAAYKEDLISRIQTLRREISYSVLEEAEAVYGTRPDLVSVRDALKILKENSSYDDTGARIQKRILQYEKIRDELGRDFERAIIDAESKSAEGLWSEAYGLLETAHRISPDDISIGERQADLITLRDAYYKVEAKKAAKSTDWRRAQEILEAYRTEVPAPEEAAMESQQLLVEKLKGTVVREEANELRRNNKYFTAFWVLLDADMDGTEDLLNEIRREGSQYYKNLIRTGMRSADGAESIGRMYLAAVKALELNPSDLEIFEMHRDLEDKVNNEIRVQIAISGFGSPVSEPQGGTQFSDYLIAYLVDHLPYGIEILERSKIDLLLRESGQELKELSSSLDVKMFVIGNVNILEVEHKLSESEATEVIRTGTEQVPNPEYSQMLMTYGSNVGKWPHRPSPTMSQHKTGVITYTIGSEKVKGLMNVSARIFDAERGAITVAKTYKSKAEAEDSFRDEVKAANITHDPLELPTDRELKEQMTEELVAQVADLIIKAFEKREWRFWERADSRVERREWDKAVAELAKGYLYCIKEGVKEDNRWFREIRQAALFDITE